ncbi:hypothetical protein M9978_16130 [Sphingomonas sp. MG17]|uniref:Lipoprotein n=1 Tax=Sphingomonas tagetis TaxID=2949092 RepID=A0A9X2HMD6_9SPHN|nr:hypothetical protein [Sphingomonas tagetis]MCP3731954.1 hypothetical protein [Sphingomonas tagetis]
MRKTGFVMLAAMLAGACQNDAQPAANAAENTAIENEADATNYQAEVIGLPLNARQGVFLRAVRDAGLTCQQVTESEKLEDREGNPTWRAICDGDSPHIISITRDGTAKILSRSDAR